MENPTVAVYCRSAQTDDNVIRLQEKRLRRFAEENGFNNLTCYIDNGESGSTLDRPAMNRLIADINASKVKTVIATDLFRIARSFKPLFEWALLLKELNVKCVTIDTGHDESLNIYNYLLFC
jgi:site-specific DNA recombinase